MRGGGLSAALARVLRFDAASSRALIFTGATRNSLVVLPLALAVSEIAAAAVVTQTLVEVLAMVLYVRLLPRLTGGGTPRHADPR